MKHDPWSFEHREPLPPDYSGLNRAIDRLTLALWGLFLVLFVAPYIIAAFKP